jgi:uncharacterized protein (TIGR02099 family)
VSAAAATTGVRAAPPPGGRPRWLRALGIVCASLLIAGAVLLLLLRIVLAGMPDRADRVKAWVERQTQLRLEFSRLDARLRWYGPELVLYDLRILDRDDHRPMLAMREGSVALDLWNVLRAGEFVAGRVSFTGPTVTVLRLPDGSIRLLGLAERPAERPPFDFDRLPAGHVQISDATVHVRDLKTRSESWTLRDLDVMLRRDRDRVVARGVARLPPTLGTRVSFEAELDGTLAEPRDLAGQVAVAAERLELAGLATLMPRDVGRPLAGAGRLDARVRFAGRQLRGLRLDLDLHDVALAPPARSAPPVEALELAAPRREAGQGPLSLPTVEKRWLRRPVTMPARIDYDRLAGQVELRRVENGWAFDLRDLRAVRPGAAVREPAWARGEFHGQAVSRHSLTLEARSVKLDDLWPLALALAPRSTDRWLGLAAHGEVRALTLALDRPRAGAAPTFQVQADLADLGAAASGSWPGIEGLTATVSGNDDAGRIALRSPALEFQWPARFVAAPLSVAAAGDVAWRREGDGWIVDGTNFSLSRDRARVRGEFELRSAGAGQAPLLRADATIAQIDVSLLRDLMPYGRLKGRSTAWLRQAFVKGTATRGVVHVEGPLDRLPFRDGTGELRIALDARDVTLNYYPGFLPIRDGAGRVVIENGGLRATLDSGQVGGLEMQRGAVAIDDLKAPVIDVDGVGRGELDEALGLLQKSPLGPLIGRQFMQLAGRGDTSFALRLHLPTRDAADRDYEVRTRLSGATVSSPLLRAPATDVSGELLVRRREIRSSGLQGSFLGGPFAVSVAPGAAHGDELDSVALAGQGRVAGAQLGDFIGLPGGIRMSGDTDWTLALTAQRERKAEPWPTRLTVASDLRGLAIDAPPPFAKTADDPRPTSFLLEYSPAGETDLEVRSGAAHARLAFRDQDGRSQFDRGALRFDTRPLTLPGHRGLQIDGDWPDFDLGQWLALGGDGPPRHALSEWLGPVNVRLARARVYGYEVRDAVAVLAAAERAWQIDLTAPQAVGRVTVPFDLRSGAPVVLAMQRLHLEPGTTAATTAGERAADPRRIPALSVAADDFVWRGRRFGQLRADLVRDPLGLRLQRFTTSSPALEIAGHGRWVVAGNATRSEIDIEASSTDLAAASVALGYRDSIEAKHARLAAHLTWPGGPTADAVSLMDGRVHVELQDGQLRNVEPGAAGRVLGLMSVVELPRRLALDFRDVTDEGLAFDSVRGDFEVRKGDAYTQNLLLSGTAVDIGVAGRTGLATQDYDQTLIVSGNPGGPLTVAGALAAGPVIGAGVLVLSQLFKGQLQGLTRAYYRVTGPWSAPVVERISAPVDAPAEERSAARDAAASLTP